MSKKTHLLCILDGFGVSANKEHNAVFHAKTPVWDNLLQTYPCSLIDASGGSVGLPNGQMGNSEVGHLNIGAGRIVTQLLPKINAAIESGSVRDKQELQNLITRTKAANNVCHLLGIFSDGGVHGYMNHVLEIAKILSEKDITVKIHAILDGRDTPPNSALEYINQALAFVKDLKNTEIVSICGRYYAMDRDNNWDRIEPSYDNMVKANITTVQDISDYIQESYASDISDEFIKPAALAGYKGIDDNDSIIFTNFRADRARQISNALFSDNFDDFSRSKAVRFASRLTMAEYSEDLSKIVPCLFPVEMPKNTLSDVIADQGMKQLHIAETEKYAHVTFFFNGGVEDPKAGEDRILIPSPNVATFDLQPEMSAPEVTDKLEQAIRSQQYDFIVVNYANADMVGHTGNFAAAIQAVEVLDNTIDKISKAILDIGGSMIITADHGNIESMYDVENDQKHTSHTLNLVPCMLISKQNVKLSDGKLCDLAPTILEIMGLDQPKEMTGKSLILT
jgi:2,3-bisphosphoglycerate-independent phosphoglycerate mutase